MFNGRIMEVPFSDLDKLRKREYGYNLRPVAYVSWGNQSEVGLAYILCAEDEFVNEIKVVDSTLLPYPPYLEVCRAGALSVSKDFLEVFEETTFLGDGETQLKNWEYE